MSDDGNQRLEASIENLNKSIDNLNRSVSELQTGDIPTIKKDIALIKQSSQSLVQNFNEIKTVQEKRGEKVSELNDKIITMQTKFKIVYASLGLVGATALGALVKDLAGLLLGG